LGVRRQIPTLISSSFSQPLAEQLQLVPLTGFALPLRPNLNFKGVILPRFNESEDVIECVIA